MLKWISFIMLINIIHFHLSLVKAAEPLQKNQGATCGPRATVWGPLTRDEVRARGERGQDAFGSNMFRKQLLSLLQDVSRCQRKVWSFTDDEEEKTGSCQKVTEESTSRCRQRGLMLVGEQSRGVGSGSKSERSWRKHKVSPFLDIRTQEGWCHK